MMVITKKLFLVFLSLICITGYSQKRRTHSKKPGTAASYKAGSFIDVNTASYPQSAYSITDLISKVLISGGSECAGPSVTNVKVSPNTAATNGNRSWGYFNAGTTDFPFSEGIILSTGYAKNAGNSYKSSTLSDNIGNQGDTDLDTAINPSQPLTNATYIEFDFVPFVEELTFNFLFASEEYTNDFPCGGYSDGFALLLKKKGDANYTNLAVLPNGDGPVSVTNIVPKPPYSCGPINEQYFGGHNIEEIETNFNGRVVPLKAHANVTPGVSYHFKMVLADAGDDMYDSAVFIDAGSFNIGVQIQDEAGVDLGSNYTLCGNDTVTLTASTSVSNPIFKWYKDGNLLTGVTGNTYTATTSGKYKVEVYIATSSCPIGEKEININAGHVPVAQNAGLGVCTEESSATFNLEDSKPKICTETGVKFQFYEKESDAYAGNLNIIPNPTSYTTSTKTIYVRVSLKDCFAVVKLDLTVAPFAAAPIISADHTALCEGGSIVLTSNQDSGNIWSTGETTKSITVTQAGTYTLKYNNGACDSESTSIIITNQPDINLMITGDLLFCEDGATVLTSSSPIGNLWSTGETTQSITVSTPGTYTVTVLTEGGCEFKKSVVVNEYPPILNNNTVITGCSSSTTYNFNLHLAEADLTSSPGITFTYYEKLSDANSGNNNFITTPESYVSGIKKIYVRLDDGNCFKISELQLNISPIPAAPVISADKTILCQGGSIVLTSSQDNGNLWSTGEITKSITVTQSGTYTLQYNDGLCDSKVANIIITDEPDIHLQITGDFILCDGETTVLTSSSPTGNVWSTGETTQSITVSTPGNYSVTVTTASGCQFKKTVKVTQTDINIVIKTPDILTCSRTQVKLDATGTNYQDGDIIIWQASNGGHIVSGADTLTPIVDTVGTYTITITRGKCSESAAVVVTEDKTIPVISVTAERLTICEGESVTLKASGGASYIWEGFPDNQTANQIVSPTETTTYTVSGIGVNGCPSIPVTITITVVPAIVSALEGGKICEGDPITLDAGSGPNYTYVWTTGETSQTITVNHIAEYSVTISNGICSETFTVQVEQADIPEITEVIYNHPQLTIIATNPQNTILEYSIDGGVTWQTSNVFDNIAKNQSYDLAVRSQNTSCSSYGQYFTFSLSNVITPDGDGYNDIIDFSGISGYQNFSARIYDRYGNEVYKADSNKKYWDGTAGSRKLSTGSYWYVIIWDDPFTKITNRKTGWIMLNLR